MAKDNIVFHDYNDSKLVDVNCGRMMPSSNLDANQAGSYAYMRKELDNAYASHNTFKSVSMNGFTPGFTTKGLEGPWGTWTNSNK